MSFDGTRGTKRKDLPHATPAKVRVQAVTPRHGLFRNQSKAMEGSETTTELGRGLAEQLAPNTVLETSDLTRDEANLKSRFANDVSPTCNLERTGTLADNTPGPLVGYNPDSEDGSTAWEELRYSRNDHCRKSDAGFDTSSKSSAACDVSSLLRTNQLDEPKTTIEDLPAELIHLICNYLDVPALKAFRLVKPDYGEIAIKHLFSVMCISDDDGRNAITQRILESQKGRRVLKQAKTLECHGSTSLDYEMRWQNMAMQLLYVGRLARTHEDPEARKYFQTWADLSKIPDKKYFETHFFYRLLKNMHSLETIKCVIDVPKVHTQIGSHLFGFGSEEFFEAVLLACGLNGTKIKNLELSFVDQQYMAFIGAINWSIGPPPPLLHASTYSGWALPHMDSLTSLTIRLRQQPGQRGYAQSITLGLLRECLRWHPNLVTFRLGFHRNDTYPVSLHSEYMPPSVWRKKLQIRGPADENTTMPKLESLLLVGISMIPAEFLAFLSPLTSSLKVLELELVGLIGIGSWVSTLPQLREWTQASALERLSIRGSLLERKGINDVTYPLRGSRIKDGETAGLDRRVIEYLMHAGEFPLASACDERDSRPYESLGKRKRLR